MIDFMARVDVHLGECPNCKGTGRDPRKRTRNCPECNGHKVIELCNKCNTKIPCPCDEGILY